MTTEQDPREPTLSDVIEKIDKLAQDQERFAQDQDRFNERFSNYQQATQWVVQLAFTLIASATLTLIITVVLKR